MINTLDGIEVNCTGECPTLIVHNNDTPGHVARVTTLLAQSGVNIATMHLYRDKRGGYAVMVIETDQQVRNCIQVPPQKRTNVRNFALKKAECSPQIFFFRASQPEWCADDTLHVLLYCGN